MELVNQVAWGTIILIACAVVHVGIVAGCVPVLVKSAKLADARFPRLKIIWLVAFGFALIVFAHTIQVWIWAISLLLRGALDSMSDAVYFSLVTYTTLGYGDIVLADDLRIFGAFASVTGLLTVGVSTAFLVGLVSRILPKNTDSL